MLRIWNKKEGNTKTNGEIKLRNSKELAILCWLIKSL